MSEETTLYEKDNIHITNLRAVFDSKTYAVSNISAVEMDTKPPSTNAGGCFSIAGGLMLFIGLSTLFRSNTGSFKPYEPNWGLFLAGIVILVIGVISVRGAKPEYIVKISTSSGEVKAWSSNDKIEIAAIVESLNNAIVKKG